MTITIAIGGTVLAGCAGTSANDKKPETTASASGKLPFTSSSDEAKKEFLLGRELSEKLQAQDSLAHLDKAISLDPNFASAELVRATSSQTTKEFFEHLKKAVQLSDHASEGERLMIQAAQAGANGDTVKQKDFLDKALAAFPSDERVNFTVGGYYFAQQDYSKAIEHYKRSIEQAPNYSPAYNIIGYAYRQTGEFDKAEKAFMKYIELIPNDPNPYDSYGELLLKMGKFENSIAQYRKALSIDKDFVASHFGIAADLMYMDKTADAISELQQITDGARSDGDKRLALFGKAVVYADAGQMDKATEMLDGEFGIAEKINDVASMAADLQARGQIQVEAGKFDEAKKTYERSQKITTESNQSSEIKDNATLFSHYNFATIAIGKQDLKAAKGEAEVFRKGAEAKQGAGLLKLSHQRDGSIALLEKNYDVAISELEAAGDQNPQNFYKLSQAYLAKGDKQKAKEFCQKAGQFNSLPQLNFAFIRAKALKDLAGMKA